MCYASKSLNPEENEMVVKRLVQASKNGLEVVPPTSRRFREGIKADESDEVSKNFVRVYPQDEGANGEGFFYCLLRRRKSTLNWDSSFFPTQDDLSTAKDSLLKLHGMPPPIPQFAAFKDLDEDDSFSTEFDLQLANSLVVTSNPVYTVLVSKSAWDIWNDLEKSKRARCGCVIAERAAGDEDGENTNEYWSIKQDSAFRVREILDQSSFVEVSGEDANTIVRDIARGNMKVTIDESLLGDELQSKHGEFLLLCKRSQQEAGKVRISKAAKKKLKKGQDGDSVAKHNSPMSQRTCVFIVERGGADDGSNIVHVTNDADYIASCTSDFFAAGSH
jgi:hypothetical protein